MAKTYRCENDRCSLGGVHNPGLFTGGATKEQVLMITGNPDAEYGKGVCPNCGQPGKEEE